MTLLAADRLEVRYGPIIAVRGLSLTLNAGEILCLVGPNGAGKSSTTLALSGAVRAAAGTVQLDGKDIIQTSAEDRSDLGVALVPEGRRIFQRMTVADNLLVACRPGLRPEDDDWLLDLFPILRSRMRQQAGLLSGGEQQQLAIARAMLRRPRVLIVDEPSLGLSPRFVQVVYDAMRVLRDRGVALLVVEQSARRAMSLADRVALMRSGRVVIEGRSTELAGNADFDKAYFGAET